VNYNQEVSMFDEIKQEWLFSDFTFREKLFSQAYFQRKRVNFIFAIVDQLWYSRG